MQHLTQGIRVLGPRDLAEAQALLARDPVVNVFLDHRARLTRLEPRWLGGEMWGWYDGGRLASMCHAAANLVAAASSPEALDAFGRTALEREASCSTVVGRVDDVEALWGIVGDVWGPARDERWDQPHLEIDCPPAVLPDPLVRRVRTDEVDTLYPACVAMYTEEVGVSPEIDGGSELYRARVSQLVRRGWAFARIEDGQVVFKAEVASASPHACQIQGVWVHPDRRGEGLAAAGMAAVVESCLQWIAPVVSLYVNAHNAAARATYAKVGFRQTATFATVML